MKQTSTNNLNPEPEWLQALFRRLTLGVKPGLDSVQRLCEKIGNPQESFAVIHIAGTNGKGSVAAMMAAVLESVGLKTGLYTSPHLVRFHERIRIAGQDIDDHLLRQVYEKCEEASRQVHVELEREPTFFEMATAMAFLAFQRAGVQVAVVETGMGGRLDATNVVLPLVSVITRIAMDHQKWLGDTLEAVAGEKAGIIKSGRPVVSGPQEPAAESVLRKVAAQRRSPWVQADDMTSVSLKSADIHEQKLHVETQEGWSGVLTLPLPGRYQLENVAIAVTALEVVFRALGLEVGFDQVRKGIRQVRWRGRCEVLMKDPLVIADAAHNPSGAQALVQTLKQNQIRKALLLTGMCGDKAVAEVSHTLGAVAAEVWTVPIASARSVAPLELAGYYQRLGLPTHVCDTAVAGLDAAMAAAREQALPLVIAGSIFLLGEMMTLDLA